MKTHGEYCSRGQDARNGGIRSGFPGGTVATLLNESKALAGNPALIRELRKSLCPVPARLQQHDPPAPCHVSRIR